MNLTQTAALTRKLVAILSAAVVLYIVFLIIRQPAKEIIYTVFPPKDLPNIAFGKLDPLEFVELEISNSKPVYKLNTRTGKLPSDLSDKMTLYKYKEPMFSYSAGKEAQEDAKELGYLDSMRVSDLSANIYTWKDVSFGGALTINTETKSLILDTPLFGRGILFQSGRLTKANAVRTAEEMLTEIRRFNDRLYTSDSTGSQTVQFGKFTTKGIVGIDALSEAQIARVDFFRSIKKFPILGPDPKQGLLHAYVRFVESGGRFLQLNFPRIYAYHWEINTEETATYPIVPASLAWQEVLENKGIITNITPNGASPFSSYTTRRIDEILVNNIYLAYYDSLKPQRYLQPIYVFEGNYRSSGGRDTGNITIYFPAIGGEYVNTPTSLQPTQP